MIRPDIGNVFLYIHASGEIYIIDLENRDQVLVDDLLIIGNCFNTIDEAKYINEKFLKLFKQNGFTRME